MASPPALPRSPTPVLPRTIPYNGKMGAGGPRFAFPTGIKRAVPSRLGPTVGMLLKE
jgi:hypothetical protein